MDNIFMQDRQSYIGVVVSIVGNICISVALNIQKYVHNKIASRSLNDTEYASLLPGIRVTEPQESYYYKEKLWWCGQALMTVGEIGNFVAYGYASAVLVAPLGTVALISNAIIAPIFLKEKFRSRDGVGIILAVAGTLAIILVSSQTEEPIFDADDLVAAMTEIPFIIYFITTCALMAILATISQNSIGRKYIYIDLLLVALFGGYTVLSTKAISSLLNTNPIDMFTHSISYLAFAVLVLTAILQITYLNKALARFNSTQVIPVNFVLFTTSTITGSAILYKDFEHMGISTIISSLFGIILMFAGVYLITSGYEEESTHQHVVDDRDSDIRSDTGTLYVPIARVSRAIGSPILSLQNSVSDLYGGRRNTQTSYKSPNSSPLKKSVSINNDEASLYIGDEEYEFGSGRKDERSTMAKYLKAISANVSPVRKMIVNAIHMPTALYIPKGETSDSKAAGQLFSSLGVGRDIENEDGDERKSRQSSSR